MGKRKWFILPVIFFLCQGAVPIQALSLESSPLNSLTNIDTGYFDGIIKNARLDSLAEFKAAFTNLSPLNEILSDCRIKPFTTYSLSEVNRSL